MLLILALGRQRKKHLSESKDNVVYSMNSKRATATQRNPVLFFKKKKKVMPIRR